MSAARLRVAVLGASGRMGRLVLAELLDAPDVQVVAAIVSPGSSSAGVDAGTLAGRGPVGLVAGPLAGPRQAGVVIDLSQPGARAAIAPQPGADQQRREPAVAQRIGQRLGIDHQFGRGLERSGGEQLDIARPPPQPPPPGE